MKHDLIRLWRRLQILGPEQTARGTGIALREYLCDGEIIGLVERFNVPKQDLRWPSLRFMGTTELCRHLGWVLDKMGVP